MKLKKYVILFTFIFIILINNFSFALTLNEANEHLEYVISYLNDENNNSIYQNYYNSYIVLYQISTSKIIVYLFNSDNTKLLSYNNYLYFTYCFSNNNITSNNFYLLRSDYNPDNNSVNNWNAFNSYNISNYLSNTSGFYIDSLNLSNYNILYCTQDILLGTSRLNKGYYETLPFDINELEIYRSSDVTQEEPDEPDEPQETQPNFYDDSKLLENLKEINDNISETNNILYCFLYGFVCWFLIDFLRHAFF